MTASTPMIEIANLIVEAGGSDIRMCMQCGNCTGLCPWPKVKAFSPRKVLRLASLGLEGYEAEDIWNCVTCRMCVQRCPRGVDMIEVVSSARSLLLAGGQAPRSINGPLGSLRTEGNPWAGNRSEWNTWMADLGLSVMDESCEWLLFACCAQAHDARNRRVSKALVELLRGAGLRFGVLGEVQNCCSEQARGIGAIDLHQELQESNMSELRKHSVQKIIVSSPHCMQSFKRSAADYGPLEIVHSAQLLDQLVTSKKLVPSRPVSLRATWHDPCYLGRHAGEYEAPRRVLKAIPGLELVEMESNRQDSLCCGGGGGGAWLEVPTEQRFAILRVREALAVNAEAIVTGCPYCIAMFEDAVKVLELEDRLVVKDLAEVLQQSV